jgi:hypothetical protein
MFESSSVDSTGMDSSTGVINVVSNDSSSSSKAKVIGGVTGGVGGGLLAIAAALYGLYRYKRGTPTAANPGEANAIELSNAAGSSSQLSRSSSQV